MEQESHKIELKPRVYEVKVDITNLTSAERIFIRSLGLAKVCEPERTYYLANTPIGRREVILSTISGDPIIGYYQVDESTGQRSMYATTVPGLPKNEITQGTYSENKATYYFPHGRPATEELF